MKSSPAQSALSVEYKVNFGNGNGKRKAKKKTVRSKKKANGIPHVTRLLALAHHLQGLIDKGVVRDYADIASLYNLSRARLSQIMNLALLAPQIQEEILCGNDKAFPAHLKERTLRIVLKSAVWKEQIKAWQKQKNIC